jgi:hypothetical protein
MEKRFEKCNRKRFLRFTTEKLEGGEGWSREIDKGALN